MCNCISLTQLAVFHLQLTLSRQLFICCIYSTRLVMIQNLKMHSGMYKQEPCIANNFDGWRTMMFHWVSFWWTNSTLWMNKSILWQSLYIMDWQDCSLKVDKVLLLQRRSIYCHFNMICIYHSIKRRISLYWEEMKMQKYMYITLRTICTAITAL